VVMATPVTAVTTGDLSDANFPTDAEGRVYHVGLKFGELANRVLIMGDPERAKRISGLLDQDKKIFCRATTRGFTTYTGFYKGIPMSIMAIGMGTPMVDFVYRECRHVTKGPLAFLRIGTCGGIRPDMPVGTICVSKSSVFCGTNYNAFLRSGASVEERYNISDPVSADAELTEHLQKQLQEAVKDEKVVVCGDATADSFYSSQGRTDPNFNDHNRELIDVLTAKHTDIGTLQMETFMMYFLSSICKQQIASSACAIVLAQRNSGDFLSNDAKHRLEGIVGSAGLDALVAWGARKTDLMDADNHCVWNQC